jgi:hypothetical protein
VIGTATVELAHPADQLQHGLGAEHEQGVAHDGRRVAMPAGDVPVDRHPAAPALLPGDGAEPEVLDQVPGHIEKLEQTNPLAVPGGGLDW